jgi:pimeloyl-ACP methyl ester carboxylesterase
MRAPPATPAAIPKRAPAPAGVALLRATFAVLGRLAPPLAARWAYRLWFATRRFPPSAHEARILGQAERIDVVHNHRPVATYAWGAGPAVLLVHGWHGSAAHFVEFVEPLTAAGFRAVACDAPAHGATPGTRTTAFEIAEALQTIGERHGPFSAVVSHSFGTPCLLLALQNGLKADKAVCISPPATVDGLVDGFSQTLGLPGAVVTRFRALLERDFGADIWRRLSPVEIARTLDLPAFLIHDRDDRAVALDEAETLARAWRGARLHVTEGLGHRRILGNREVIERGVAFLRT